jgi:hypothetical protein
MDGWMDEWMDESWVHSHQNKGVPHAESGSQGLLIQECPSEWVLYIVQTR